MTGQVRQARQRTEAPTVGPKALLAKNTQRRAEVGTMASSSCHRARRPNAVAQQSNPNRDVWCTLQSAKITVVYGLGDGRVLYEGCDGLLNDGQACELGKSARRDQSRGRPIPASKNLRDRTGHVCRPIDCGKKMWNFVVVIDDLHIDVFEGPGQDLLGMSGQAWEDQFGPNAYAEDIMERVEDGR